jgi:hypothetical protein
MRTMRRALVLMFFAALLAAPGQAFGLTVAPPGHSGSDQYFETVPTSSGNAAPPAGPTKGKGADRSIDRLGHSRGALRKLSHMGTAGQAAALLAASTAPSATGSASNGNGNGSGSGIGLAPASKGLSQPQGEGAASALASALTGSDQGGLGWILPIGLLAALLAALLLAAARLRRGSEPPDAAT